MMLCRFAAARSPGAPASGWLKPAAAPARAWSIQPGGIPATSTWAYGPGWETLLLKAYGVAPDPDRTRYYRLLYDPDS